MKTTNTPRPPRATTNTPRPQGATTPRPLGATTPRPLRAHTTTTSRLAQQYIIFDTEGHYRLHDTWQEAMVSLGVKKHEFYFALNHGTPAANHFIDIYINAEERRRIQQADIARTAAQHHNSHNK